MKQNNNYSTKISVKLISAGDIEVGKSCLIKRYCEGSFIKDYITTIGIDYGVKKANFNDTLLAINIFDLSGDDDYKLVRDPYYKDSLGVIFVYDVNIKSTFDSIPKWEKEAEKNGLTLSNCIVILIGNKVDRNKREVKTSTGQDYAKKKGYYFYETSAKTGSNVKEAFKFLFDTMYHKSIENRAKYIY